MEPRIVSPANTNPDIVFHAQRDNVADLLVALGKFDNEPLLATDIGGVLVQGGVCDLYWRKDSFKEITRMYGGDALELLMYYESAHRRSQLNEVDEVEVLRGLANMTDLATWQDLFRLLAHRNQTNFGLELLYQLKKRDWQIVVHSNIDSLWYHEMSTRFQWRDFVKNKVLSFEIGCLKPDREFMDIVDNVAENRKGWFIDDSVANIEMARASGWRTILVHNHPWN